MEEKDNSFWEKIIVKGLNTVINNSGYKDLADLIYQKHIDILETRLDLVEPSIQRKIVEGLMHKDPNLLKEPFWIAYVDKALEVFSDATNQYVFDNGALYVLLNRIKDLTSKVDWFGVLIKLSNATAEMGSKAPGFSTVLEWMIMADKNNLLTLLHRTETKQYPQELKIDLYKQLVEFGLLDVKIARRIRSDSSGSLSHKVLEFLFSNRNIYTNDDFQNLITQFSDTKHKWVARFMALNMPLHLAPFLMGLEDKLALQLLEKRMNGSED